MPTKTKAKSKQKPEDQVKAFRKAARDLGCDNNEERFREAVQTVAKHKPKAEKPKQEFG
jgi:hypothetical protein